MTQENTTQEALSKESQATFDKILAAVSSGEMTLQQATGITEEQLEAMYSVAYNLFANEKYQDAIDAFSLLQTIAPMNYKIAFGLAASLQMLEKYIEAIILFTFTSSLEEKNPAPMLHLAECYMAVDDKAAAVHSLKLVLERCDNSSLGNAIRTRAEIMLENIEG
ncbi:MAG: SycD/LcrH family type III secretion system chaperone [Pseudomonadota bacterium]